MEPAKNNPSAKKFLWYMIQFEVMSIVLGIALANITINQNLAFNPAGVLIDEPSFFPTAIAYYVVANILLMPLLVGTLLRNSK